MEFVDEEATTVEKAVKNALAKLNANIGDVRYVVLKREPIIVRVYKKFKELEDIEEFLNEFFQKIGTDGKITIYPESKSTLYINIKTKGMDKVLIGKNGKTLEELNYLLKLIFKRKFGAKLRFIFDINGYKKKREEYLVNKAIATAKLAIENKLEYTLDPLNNYERRIVISKLSKMEGIRIERVGRGKNMRLVVVPNVK
ncbi:MAG: hypothetical protein N2504_05310 [candidate division WOR-3 bacterium]|nr:hypothetical protein [candidate division WOR-3 bacterium]MCX7947989.1 hypothetical protein [candidate division WOR-3 bacterium]MDW8151205.1 hypothetical protein [candidate division WOR-3 bacterium]